MVGVDTRTLYICSNMRSSISRLGHGEQVLAWCNGR